MRKLSSLFLLLGLSVSLFAQKSPHGDGFAVNCMDCHSTTGWKMISKHFHSTMARRSSHWLDSISPYPASYVIPPWNFLKPEKNVFPVTQISTTKQ